MLYKVPNLNLELFLDFTMQLDETGETGWFWLVEVHFMHFLFSSSMFELVETRNLIDRGLAKSIA